MLKRLLKNKWSVLSLIRSPLVLIAGYYKTFHQIRNLIAQLDFKKIDRTLILKTSAIKKFSHSPINYVDIGARGGLLDFLKPFESVLNTMFFEPDTEEGLGTDAESLRTVPGEH